MRRIRFQVIDLGVDTSPDRFIEAVEEHKAPLLGMSALLTTTMPNMGKTIEVKCANIRSGCHAATMTSATIDRFIEQKQTPGYANATINRWLEALHRAYTLRTNALPPAVI